jgi:replicative DNA helicase
MIYNLGLRALRRIVEDQKALDWHKHKVSESLFISGEVEVFTWVNAHLTKFHQLPQLETLCSQFPEVKELDTPEPFAYYLDHLQDRYAYRLINNSNLESQKMLKEDKNAIKPAVALMEKTIGLIKGQEYRTKIMDVGKESGKLVLAQYHNTLQNDLLAEFGWPYLDEMTGGALPGDVISYVGRPAMGKTWLILFSALLNWRKGRSVMLTSMEMNILAIAQRLTAMYSKTPISQLKMGGFSSSTYKTFAGGLLEMGQETGKFYVVDGNLAASAEDVYLLASQLGVSSVYIDGAYLLKHSNPRLDRFTRVAENVELMKGATTELEIPTFASWQLNREAAKAQKKTGQSAGLEDIGYSDAIGQISSIVLALLQEEGVETLNQRSVDVLKGRSGEIGKFGINWGFQTMDFNQVGTEGNPDQNSGLLNYI